MTVRRTVAAALLVCALGTAGVWAAGAQAPAADTLPARLGDQEFWKLSLDLSEPNGSFRSDNLLSNEIWLQYVLKDLQARAGSGGVYVGVGPEQNFTYIAALQPKMVFFTDIRRGNLHTHLMYKALFEMSADRAEFVSRLFTKKRPDTLTRTSTAPQIMDAFWEIPTSAEAVYKENLQAIKDWLTKKPHALPLDADDLAGIEYVYYNFYWFGPSITYSSTSGGGGRSNMANYYQLMVADDGAGALRSFLASDESFTFLKGLHQRNLVVPVVGDFAGPKALRAVGQYIRDHRSTVTAFYLSNVEQYLNQEGKWSRFCANVATMPLTDRSTFIRSSQGRGGGGGSGLMNELGAMQAETRQCGGGL